MHESKHGSCLLGRGRPEGLMLPAGQLGSVNLPAACWPRSYTPKCSRHNEDFSHGIFRPAEGAGGGWSPIFTTGTQELLDPACRPMLLQSIKARCKHPVKPIKVPFATFRSPVVP